MGGADDVGGAPGRRAPPPAPWETSLTHPPAYDPLDTIRWMLEEARAELRGRPEPLEAMTERALAPA